MPATRAKAGEKGVPIPGNKATHLSRDEAYRDRLGDAGVTQNRPPALRVEERMNTFGSRWSNFWFKLLFPRQYEHMRHLVDDVIRLEEEKKCLPATITGSANVTIYWRSGDAVRC